MRLGEAVGGVVLPALLASVTAAPHRYSLSVCTPAFRLIIADFLDGLVRAGFTTIAVVTGPYAPAHEIELYEAALRVMDDFPGVRVFAAAPLELLGDEGLLDHGGKVETSLLQALRPDLVDLGAFDRSGVLGEDPEVALDEEGVELLERAVEAWRVWMTVHAKALSEWYSARFDAHQPFVDAYYKGSWEDANLAWWADWAR